MENKEPNTLEVLQAGANAAKIIQGAVKTGKAISGAGKGAAVAGPYGAAAVLIWENRSLIAKGLAALCLLILIPVLFILLLPSIIFDGLESKSETPVLNNNAAIIENINEAENIVNSILGNSYQHVLNKINKEIANLPENESGILEGNANTLVSNTFLLISQYTAEKTDYREINLKDLNNVVGKGKDNLYSYRRISESTVDEETGELFTTHTYFIDYIGDDYFASNVFLLSEEQRMTANQYAQNLTIFIYGTNFHGGAGTSTVSEDVLRYEPLIRKYAELHGIPEFVEVIKAIMMQESGGRLADVMQASECPYNTRYPKKPGSIDDPEYSIDVGIANFADCLRQSGCVSPSDMGKLSLALQGYNFGGGYISWAISRYGGFSEINAVEFSNMKKAQLGWPRYGDTKYVQHVLRYYNPYSGVNADGFGSPFASRNWQEAVTSEYGYRIDPITGKAGAFHDGIDIAYPIGTPINTIADGTVINVINSNIGYGNNVTIDHGNGITSMYAHCSSLLVTRGQTVRQGDIIALVGKSGRVTGAHLHLTIKKDGNLENPRSYIQ